MRQRQIYGETNKDSYSVLFRKWEANPVYDVGHFEEMKTHGVHNSSSAQFTLKFKKLGSKDMLATLHH